MARRAARPEVTRQGTHPVIIVFLVFSILLSLVLGVLFYLERDKTKQARDAEARVRAELNDANKRLDMYGNWLLPLVLAWIWPENEALKEGDFAEACRRFVEYLNTPPENRPRDVPEIFVKAAEFIQKAEMLGKYGVEQGGRLEPFTQKGRAPSLARRVGEALKQVAGYKLELDGLTRQFSELRGEFDRYKAAWNENRLKEELDKQAQQHKQELAKKEQEWEARLKGLEAKLQSLHQELEKRLKQVRAEADEEKKQLLEETNKRLAEMEAEVQRMRAAARPRLELSRLVQPSGMILGVSRTGDQVIIDRGKIHRLPEGITFSVYPTDSGKRIIPKIKAMVQVVRVEDRIAIARVTRIVKPEHLRDPAWDEFDERYWLTDPSQFVLLRDPIRVGDVVYNSAWRPNEPVHIALAGLIDIDGDGRDDSDTFKRLLRERGVVIDLHLRYTGTEYVQEGRLTDRTDMLVVGVNPVVRPVAKPAEGEEGKPREQKDLFEQLEQEARRRGMDVIGVRQFLLQMGFFDLRALVRSGAAPEKPAAGEKPAEGQ